MGLLALNDLRNVLQRWVLPDLTDDLVFCDTDDLRLHHLVVTLRFFRSFHDTLVHLLVRLVGLLQLRKVVFVQLELFFGLAIFILLIAILDDAFHGRAFARQVEHGLTLRIEQLDFIGLVLKVEEFDFFFLEGILEDEFVLFKIGPILFLRHIPLGYHFVAIPHRTIVELVDDIRDVDLGRVVRNLLFHELDELFSGPSSTVQVILSSPLAIADIASFNSARNHHIGKPSCNTIFFATVIQLIKSLVWRWAVGGCLTFF